MYVFIIISLVISIILYFVIDDTNVYYSDKNQDDIKQFTPLIYTKETPISDKIKNVSKKTIHGLINKKETPKSNKNQGVKKKVKVLIDKKNIDKYSSSLENVNIPPKFLQRSPNTYYIQTPTSVPIKGKLKQSYQPEVKNIVNSFIENNNKTFKSNLNNFLSKNSTFDATQLTACNTKNPTLDDIICNLKFQYKIQSFI